MDELFEQRKRISFYVYPGLKMIPNGTVVKKCETLCIANGTTIEKIKSPSRKYELVAIRQSICLLAKERTTLSTNQIGSLVDRDHATVIHSVKTAKTRKETCESKFLKIFDICKEYL
jgi:chromosomal replication initiation ATPase DnaA